MDRLHRTSEPAERRSEEVDHTALWFSLVLLGIAALVVAVLMGDSIAFPVG